MGARGGGRPREHVLLGPTHYADWHAFESRKDRTIGWTLCKRDDDLLHTGNTQDALGNTHDQRPSGKGLQHFPGKSGRGHTRLHNGHYWFCILHGDGASPLCLHSRSKRQRSRMPFSSAARAACHRSSMGTPLRSAMVRRSWRPSERLRSHIMGPTYLF